MGSYLFGTYLLIVCVVVHHIHVGINIRDWNIAYAIATLVSIAFLPLILWACNRIPSAVVYLSFGYIIS